MYVNQLNYTTMKKLFLTALAALAMTLTTQAQDLFSIGARGAINFSSLTGGDAAEVSSDAGWNFGLTAELRPFEKLSFTVDAMYSKTKINEDASDDFLKLGYLDIPIMANYYFAKGFHIKAGIQPSINLSAKTSLGDVSDKIKNGAFSIPVGIGYTTDMGLGVDVRYNISTTETYDFDELDLKTSSFVVGVYFRF